MKININEAIQFLSAYEENLIITFQVFDDTKNGRGAYHKTLDFNEKDVQQILTEANLNGMGIYFMVNKGDGNGRSYENITDLRAFAVDLDGAPLQPLLDCPVTPNFIIESSPGKYQAHWLINPIAISRFASNREDALLKAKEKFAAIQVALARRFKADESIKDLPRVLRVPGFYHNKKEPFLSRIIQNDRVQPYDAEDFLDKMSLNFEEVAKELKAPMPSTDHLLQNKLGPSERHDGLTKLAYKYAHQGMDRNALIWTMQGANQNLCSPPIDRPGELERIIDTAIAKASKNGVKIPALPPPPKIDPSSIPSFIGSEWFTKPQVIPDPILANLFDKGDKVALIGQSKTRKSFFALQLGLKVALGHRFLSFDPPAPLKVLVIQYEIKKDRYHTRCLRMIEKLGVEPSELSNIIIVNARGIDVDPVELVFAQAEIHKPDLIIIDPLYKLIAGDESKIEEVKPILRKFDLISEKYGSAIVYVHHDKKGVSGDSQLTDRGAGSGVIARDFDSAIFLSPHKDEEDTLVAEFLTRNYAPPKGISVKWDEYNFQMSMASLEKQTSQNQRNKKLKFSQHIEKAKDLVIHMAESLETRISVNMFDIKLSDLGIAINRHSPIRKQLILDGLLAEEDNTKRKRGEPAKHLIVTYKAPEDLEEVGQSEFMSHYEDYSEQPF